MARNFGQLKSAVQADVIDVPTALVAEVGNLVNRAIRVAQELHNFKCMEATSEYVTVPSTRSLTTLPTNWKASRGLPWTRDDDGTTNEIGWLTDDLDAVRSFSIDPDVDIGAPAYLLETTSSLDLYPFSDSMSDWTDGEYRINVPYWAYLNELSDDSDSNWFTQNAEWFIIWQAASDAIDFNVWAERVQNRQQKAAAELARVIKVDKQNRIGRNLILPAQSSSLSAPNTRRISYPGS